MKKSKITSTIEKLNYQKIQLEKNNKDFLKVKKQMEGFEKKHNNQNNSDIEKK